ncbi:MAG: hypothetical protein LAO21_06840 [Acidobacteriia bacterium]|nr:hypothetical protein [Terriglobia bacterium]
MNTLTIQPRDNKTRFLPGEEVAGTVSWYLDQSLKTFELRLFWYTKGRGTSDTGIVENIRFENPEPEGRREFRFVLPDGPYSFAGTLITLNWALELVAEPTREAARVDIVVSPSGREIVVQRLESRSYTHQ